MSVWMTLNFIPRVKKGQKICASIIKNCLVAMSGWMSLMNIMFVIFYKIGINSLTLVILLAPPSPIKPNLMLAYRMNIFNQFRSIFVW